MTLTDYPMFPGCAADGTLFCKETRTEDGRVVRHVPACEHCIHGVPEDDPALH